MNQEALKQFIPLLIERLKPVDPVKVILFGSYASGTPDEDSDIDLLVVTNSDHFPQSYTEKSAIYLEVSQQLRDLRGQVSIDLMVHTRPMHQKFIELNSMFSKEITQNGIVLYEAKRRDGFSLAALSP
ncbi:MAG: nucleotidyltransferase domain-containing protein [Anaerolineae bacterium]|nr:nucleotidyltransferase domain-containing protein [Anaerolineae bacterium]